MVVGHDNAAGTIGQRIGKDLPWMNRAAIHQPNGNDSHVQDFVGAVNGNGKEMFLPAVGAMADER